MRTSSLPSIASSGLAANQARLEVAAHNLANASTANFKRQELAQEARAEGGVVAHLRQADAQEAQQRAAEARAAESRVNETNETRVAQDMVDQRVAMQHFQANLQAMQRGQAAIGTLLDLTA
ncbi:flagellar basal body protein [Ideonella sp.]|uniref:flagellar basal body protein n=1 Tax=Ideonella sp. TaxID=1929293 RepID=UPI003BB4947B